MKNRLTVLGSPKPAKTRRCRHFLNCVNPTFDAFTGLSHPEQLFITALFLQHVDDQGVLSCATNGYIGMVGRGSTIYTNPESNKKMSTILDPQTQSNWVENELSLSLSTFDGVVSLEPWNCLTKWKNTVKGTNGTLNSMKGTHHHGSPWPGMCVYDCICTMSIHVYLYVSSNNVLLVKIEGSVWYTIYHHLPVVKGVCPNTSINQPTNGKRTSMVSSIDIVTNKMSTKCIHIDMYKN